MNKIKTEGILRILSKKKKYSLNTYNICQIMVLHLLTGSTLICVDLSRCEIKHTALRNAQRVVALFFDIIVNRELKGS